MGGEGLKERRGQLARWPPGAVGEVGVAQERGGQVLVEPGVIIDRYRVEVLIGRGGIATVWRVRHRELGQVAALKVLDIPSPGLRQRMMQEGRLQASVQHPNLLAVGDVLDVAGCPALILEFVPGPSLDRVLVERRLTLDQADFLARGVLAGVAHAHARGLVHRDLKPANLLLACSDDTLVPKVADFGLAKALGEGGSSSGTRTGQLLGTPAYMAPEQVDDAGRVDARADVFALGAILFELVTGQRAFPEERLLDLLSAARGARRVDPRQACPGLPERMAQAIAAALEPEPRLRPVDAGALLRLWVGESQAPPFPFSSAELAELGALGPNAGAPERDVATYDEPPPEARELPTLAPPTLPERPPSARPPRRTWPRIAAVGVGALLMVALGGLGWFALPEAGSLVDPRRGGQLELVHFRSLGELEVHDPALGPWQSVRWDVVEPILTFTLDGEVLPGVTRLVSSGDRQVELALVGERWFHPHPCTGPEGRPVTLPDVRASILDGLPRLTAKVRLEHVEVDAAQGLVRVQLSEPHAFLALHLGEVPVVPEGLEACMAAAGGPFWPAGTGPFRLEGPANGGVLELVRHERYPAGLADRQGLPLLDRLRVRGEAEPERTSRELLTGDAHLARFLRYEGLFRQPDPASLRPDLAEAGLWGATEPDPMAAVWRGLLFLDRSPTAPSRALREAIHLTLERSALLRSPHSAHHQPTRRFVLPSMPGHDPLVATEPDPERARQLVAAEGRATPLILGHFASDQPNAEEIAQQLRAVGLEVRLVELTPATLPGVLAEHRVDAALLLTGYSGLLDEPYGLLLAVLGGMAEQGMGDDQVQHHLRELGRHVDRVARQRAYAAAEAYLLSDLRALPISQSVRRGLSTAPYVLRPEVRGFADPEAHFRAGSINAPRFDRVWLAKPAGRGGKGGKASP